MKYIGPAGTSSRRFLKKVRKNESPPILRQSAFRDTVGCGSNGGALSSGHQGRAARQRNRNRHGERTTVPAV